MMRKVLLCTFLSFFMACSGEGKDNVTDYNPDIPLTPGGKEDVASKPKAMWIDAHANFSRLSTKEAITTYLEKIKSVGLNEVYVDVKPGIGYALYDSDILPKLEKWGDETVKRDWDYLGYWLSEGERLGVDVIASISTLGYGATRYKQGLIYDDEAKWNGKTQVAMKNGNLEDIKDNTNVDAAMLNPCLTDVQEFVLSVVQEIVRKYPKLKGISLDYCRWYNSDGDAWYGFGDETIKAFEAYSGEKVNSRTDILTASGAPGKLFAKWIEFRSMVVKNLISNIHDKAKAINPKLEIHLWASAHWTSRYSVGQNWASDKYVPSGSVYTSNYHNTGFANQLDVFITGAYADAVWEKDSPGSEWSVEHFVKNYSNYIQGDCKVYGSFAAYSQKTKNEISDAVYLCLKNTDGVMVFELSHVINFNTWDGIKEGIERAE